jgi:hypothetical protein
MPHARGSFARLADDGEDLLEFGIEDLLHHHTSFTPVYRQLFDLSLYTLFNGLKSAPQRFVVEGLEFGLTRVDRFDDRSHSLDITIVLRPDNELYRFFE